MADKAIAAVAVRVMAMACAMFITVHGASVAMGAFMDRADRAGPGRSLHKLAEYGREHEQD